MVVIATSGVGLTVAFGLKVAGLESGVERAGLVVAVLLASGRKAARGWVRCGGSLVGAIFLTLAMGGIVIEEA